MPQVFFKFRYFLYHPGNHVITHTDKNLYWLIDWQNMGAGKEDDKGKAM